MKIGNINNIKHLNRVTKNIDTVFHFAATADLKEADNKPFLTLENNTIIHYYMNALYKSKGDRGIRYNDPSFKIKFPIKPKLISLRDKTFKDFNI